MIFKTKELSHNEDRGRKTSKRILHENHEKHEKMDKDILYKNECYRIQGAVFEVYREMGCGFLEAVYQECMEKELLKKGIPFTPQKELKLMYKGELLRQTYKPDLICYSSIIVELKALSVTTGEHKAQVLNYLKATGNHLALLVNFGCYPKATVERLVLYNILCLSCFSWTPKRLESCFLLK